MLFRFTAAQAQAVELGKLGVKELKDTSSMPRHVLFSKMIGGVNDKVDPAALTLAFLNEFGALTKELLKDAGVSFAPWRQCYGM